MKTLNFSGIASHTGMPCITISMNTDTPLNESDHRYTELSRLADQARFLVEEKANGVSDNYILDKLRSLPDEVPLGQESGSISIFLSDTTKEILYSPWPVPQNRVQVADRFDLRPLIEINNNHCEYNLLVLHHKKIRLLKAKNDKVACEVKDDFFPVTTGLEFLRPSKDLHFDTSSYDLFDRLDKELIARFNKTKTRYVVAAFQPVYAAFIGKVRFRSLYPAHIQLTNDLTYHALASAAWDRLLELKDKERKRMIDMVAMLAAEGKALTATHEILVAAREGRGDVLVVDWGAHLTEEEETLYCEIIWHVIRHKGKVVMAETPELGALGSIALKLCY